VDDAAKNKGWVTRQTDGHRSNWIIAFIAYKDLMNAASLALYTLRIESISFSGSIKTNRLIIELPARTLPGG